MLHARPHACTRGVCEMRKKIGKRMRNLILSTRVYQRETSQTRQFHHTYIFFSSLEMLNLTLRVYNFEIYISNCEMQTLSARAPSVRRTRISFLMREQLFSLFSFAPIALLKPHSRLLHYAAHTSKQIAEEERTLHADLSQQRRTCTILDPARGFT